MAKGLKNKNHISEKDPELEIQNDLESIQKKASIYKLKNFEKRLKTIDFIEFQILGHIEYLQVNKINSDRLNLLKSHAENIICKLEEVNLNLFKKLQEKIRTGKYRGKNFKKLIKKYIDIKIEDKDHSRSIGYDNLDIFINGLFTSHKLPEQTLILEPDMVYYQKTPARIVFELIKIASIDNNGVFFDLGSGVGQVAILVHLLTKIKTIGIEYEPAFCDLANTWANELRLSKVKVINMDARHADYSLGSIFFMFTPFKGKIMEEVLNKLEKQAQLRKIKIITYGPCTVEVALQSWLEFINYKDKNPNKLALFSSL